MLYVVRTVFEKVLLVPFPLGSQELFSTEFGRGNIFDEYSKLVSLSP